MNEFKVGDEVRVSDDNDYNQCKNGQIGVICMIDGTNVPYRLRFKNGSASWIEKVEKVEGKKPSEKQPDKNFRVIQRDCKNFIGDYETLAEAKKQKPSEGTIYDIYEKVGTTTSELKTKFKSVKKTGDKKFSKRR